MQTTTDLIPSRRTFWIVWTLSSAVSWIVGMGLAWLASGLTLGLLEGPGLVAFWAVGGLLVGLCFGLSQWRIFRSRPDHPLRASAGRWVWANLIGWSLGLSLVIGLGAGAAYGFAAGGGLIGLIVAIPQWWLLRGISRRAWAWIPVGGFAWLVGLAAIDLLGRSAGFGLAGAIGGAVSGAALLWLLPADPA